MGKGEDCRVTFLRQFGGIGRDEVERRPGEARENRGDRFTGVFTRSDRDDFDARVAQQNAQKFLSGVSGGAENGDFDLFHFQQSFLVEVVVFR